MDMGSESELTLPAESGVCLGSRTGDQTMREQPHEQRKELPTGPVPTLLNDTPGKQSAQHLSLSSFHRCALQPCFAQVLQWALSPSGVSQGTPSVPSSMLRFSTYLRLPHHHLSTAALERSRCHSEHPSLYLSCWLINASHVSSILTPLLCPQMGQDPCRHFTC